MDDEDDHYFWMKNTLIPLDIVFIGKDLTVAGILEKLQPHDTNSKGVGSPRCVLEVNEMDPRSRCRPGYTNLRWSRGGAR
jgi:uncharacterized membrane protein (UPF0127 family)